MNPSRALARPTTVTRMPYRTASRAVFASSARTSHWPTVPKAPSQTRSGFTGLSDTFRMEPSVTPQPTEEQGQAEPIRPTTSQRRQPPARSLDRRSSWATPRRGRPRWVEAWPTVTDAQDYVVMDDLFIP